MDVSGKAFLRPRLVLGVVAAGWLAASPAVAAEKAVMAGKVVTVEGRVLMRPSQAGAPGSRPAGPLKVGEEVHAGDVINTASDGSVKLLLADKTILDLGPSALFRVQKFEPRGGNDRQVDIEMPYGTVRAAVSKPLSGGGKFQIRTKTATMGVRGTEFVVQSAMGSLSRKDTASQAKPETKITVVQGKVEVAQSAASGGGTGGARLPAGGTSPVMLTAGTQLTASVGAPVAKPIKLNAAEMSAVTASAQVVDNTFTKAITLDNTRPDNGGGSGNGNGNGNGGGSSGNAGAGAGGSGGSGGGGESSASGSASSGGSGGGGGESGGGGGAGQATRDAISVAIASPSAPAPVAPVTIQLPVAPKPQSLTPFIPVGGLKRVHIVVTQ